MSYFRTGFLLKGFAIFNIVQGQYLFSVVGGLLHSLLFHQAKMLKEMIIFFWKN